MILWKVVTPGLRRRTEIELEEGQNNSLHDTAALRALADGGDNLDVNEPDAEEETETSAPTAGERNDADPLSSLAEPQASSVAAGGATNKIRAAKSTLQPAHAVSVQFRKLAVPLLFFMAALLIVAGIFTLKKVSGADPEDLAGNPLLENGRLFAGISIAMGVCLAEGGLFFLHEIRKVRKRFEER